MKRVLSIAVVLLMCATLFVVGFAADEEEIVGGGTSVLDTTPDNIVTGEWKIAVVPKAENSAWFARMKEGVDQFAAETGMEVFQKGPSDFDAAAQVQVIQDLIAQDLDAICVVPIDTGAVEPVLKEAMDKGILVICHEAPSIENMDYDLEAFSNDAFGAFIMDNLAEAMGEEGVYTTSVGFLTSETHNIWADSAVARAEEAYPNMTLLEEEPRFETEDNMELAYERSKEMLKKYPDLKGFVGTASQNSVGFGRTIEELGKVGEVFTVGAGVPSEYKDYLLNGSVAYLTLWDPAAAGYATVDLATKILNGDELGGTMDLNVAGYHEVVFDDAIESGKVLKGEAMLAVDSNNIDQFEF